MSVTSASGEHLTDASPQAAGSNRARFLASALGSIGVVYGDIGTSPLYAMREALIHSQEGGITREEVLGVTSLLLWALLFIVTAKYVLFLMRADNDGEGGTLSLMALAQRALGRPTTTVFILGVAGAALFYGDALITPAISVLSAVEGLKLVTPVLDPYVIPITVAILFLLFAAQRHGTGKVAALFGPITLVWFIAIGLLGVHHIQDDLGVLASFNPAHAVAFIASHGLVGLVVLGSVFLAVTGAEALYADMGHFGRAPIQAAWIAVVFPTLALNYLGQAALILKNPDAIANPFFLMAPDWALLPMVLLATVATVIASQAVITGAFSVTQQAIQLGLLPRMEIQYTSRWPSSRSSRPSCPTPTVSSCLASVLGVQLPDLWRPRLGLRHRRHRYDGGHRLSCVHRGLEGMALAPHPGHPVHRPLPDRRCRVLHRQPVEGARRRLHASDDRRRDHSRHVDLGPWDATDLP